MLARLTRPMCEYSSQEYAPERQWLTVVDNRRFARSEADQVRPWHDAVASRRHIRGCGSVTVRAAFPECEEPPVTLRDIPVNTLSGQPASLSDDDLSGKTLLVVNVASKCGLTPQYAGLERLQERYAERGFTVLGVPCNQFMGQEPGTPRRSPSSARPRTACTFPLFEKIDVNGDDRHPMYAGSPVDARRRRRGRRHPVELREVPGRAGRHGGRPLPAANRARCTSSRRRHRGKPGL